MNSCSYYTGKQLNGSTLLLNKSLISVTMDNEENASLYVPADELLEKLGYIINYDNEKNTIDLITGNSSQKVIDNTVSEGNVVINLANNASQKNIAESGSFQAAENQTLVLNIISDIKGGTVDLFLFDPNGKEQHITIGSSNLTKEIALEKGFWQYNCSGIFKDGGNIKIVGTIR